MDRVDGERLDRAIGLLALARQHNLLLAIHNGTLQVKRETKEINPNFELIIKTFSTHKEDLIAILQDPNAIRQWLDSSQEKLATKYNVLTDGMDAWQRVEDMYRQLYQDTSCVCEQGQCRVEALINCTACVGKVRSNG